MPTIILRSMVTGTHSERNRRTSQKTRYAAASEIRSGFRAQGSKRKNAMIPVSVRTITSLTGSEVQRAFIFD